MHDLNGDGVADLVVLVRQGIAVVPGHEDGTFGRAKIVRIADADHDPDGPSGGVVVGDIDRDGHPDIVASEDLRGVWILRGRGGFVFAPPVGRKVDALVEEAPVLADVDGDGITDVMVPSLFHTSVIYRKREGTLSAPVTLRALADTTDFAVEDLNHDKIPDIVCTTIEKDGFEVLLGRGGGHFAPPVLYGEAVDPSSIAVDDVNGDGVPDVVSGVPNESFAPQVIVFAGRGDGTFSTPTIPEDLVGESGTDESVLADANGDGELDFFTTNAVGTVSVLLNHGDGTFETGKLAHDIDVIRQAERRSHELVHAAQVDPESLRFHGSRLTWAVAGKPASALLK